MKLFLIAPLLLITTFSAFGQASTKTTIGMMDFMVSGVATPEAVLLADALLTEIVDTKVFEVVERSRRDEILREQGFAQTGACDETSCLIEAGKMLAVQKMVGGSVGLLGKTWSINVRLIDVLTGRVDKAFTKHYKGDIDQLLLNMREVAWDIALSMGITSEALKKQYRKKPSPILFGKLKGTKLKYPAITYGVLSLGAALAASAFYFNDKADNAYQEYLAATTDDEILKYKTIVKHNDQRVNQASYASAVCFVGAAASYLLRVKKPAEYLSKKAVPAINFTLAPKDDCNAIWTVSLSWRVTK